VDNINQDFYLYRTDFPGIGNKTFQIDFQYPGLCVEAGVITSTQTAIPTPTPTTDITPTPTPNTNSAEQNCLSSGGNWDAAWSECKTNTTTPISTTTPTNTVTPTPTPKYGCPNSNIGSISSEFDIYAPALTYTTLLDSTSIWVRFKFSHEDTEGNYYWKLTEYGENTDCSMSDLGTVNSQYSIHISSIYYQPEGMTLFHFQNLWLDLNYSHTQGTDMFWKYVGHGVNE